MPKIRIHAVLAFLMAGLLVILSAQYILNIYAVKKPLGESITGIKGVSGFAMDEKSPEPTVSVRLDADADLPLAYGLLEETVARSLGDKARITIDNNRASRDLEAKWDVIHYHVEEAASRGTFSEMKEALDDWTNENGIPIKSWVDDGYIFIRISDGGRYLHKVVPRRDAVVTRETASVKEA